MQLFLNATSPYARVVRVAAEELGMMQQIELCWTDPWSDPQALLHINPAARIPALLLEDGRSISESLLIACYLNSLDPGSRLLPAAQLVDCLHLAGLGQGLMDASFATVIARKHHGGESDQTLLGSRRLRAIERLLEQLQTDWLPSGSTPHLGDLVIAVALDYLAFRMPECNWQQRYPSLASRHALLAQRNSFSASAFV
ncbi:MAG: glutathione S-transferase N-terminal domain-containing protein [Halopseudomonas yangmingensis]